MAPAKSSAAKAKKSSPAKTAAKTASKTPKPKSGKKVKVPLVRDLNNLSEGVQRKLKQIVLSNDYLNGVKDLADKISTAVDDANKEQEERVGKVEADISHHKLEKAQEALKKVNKTAIDKFEYKKLRDLREKKQLDKKDQDKNVKKEVNEEVARQVRFHQERFEQEYAGYKAREAVFSAERKTLKATIAGLRMEIESQKSLSSEIAKANQQHKINVARRKAIEEHQRKEDAMRGIVPGASPPLAAAPAAPAAALKATGAKPAAAPASTPISKQSSMMSSGSTEDDDTEEEDSSPPPKAARKAGKKPGGKKH
eukprot:TRINITY_DN8324_c0_g2_i1.p1 TRINITY_DN8324_c0_g2~~TRINITY_DN8324_c0_g2_i1.p1  ORF type:complete len:350 (+),score=161.16 TRINITY_DN8324_c0_g2_i1:119-1051(+)